MLDYNKVRDALVEKLGQQKYQMWLLDIAEALQNIDPESFPQNGHINDFVAKAVLDMLSDKSRVMRKTEIIEHHHTRLDTMQEHANIRGINDFVEVRDTRKHIVEPTLQARMQRLMELKKALLEDQKLVLSHIPVGAGSQTANDWISDLVRKGFDKDEKFMEEVVTELYEISKQNYKRNTVTELIRKLAARRNILKMDSRDICSQLGIEYNGSNRKLISRLKKEAV